MIVSFLEMFFFHASHSTAHRPAVCHAAARHFSPDEMNGASSETLPENTLQIFSHLLVAVAIITTTKMINFSISQKS